MLPRLLDPRPSLADLRDPRRETRNQRHALHDLLITAVSAWATAANPALVNE